MCILVVFVSLLLVSCNAEKGEENISTEKATNETEDQQASSTVMVVRLKENVSKGSYIELKDLELADVEPASLPEGYIAKSSDVVGRRVLSALKKGDYLTEDVLGKKKAESEKDESSDQITKSMAKKLGYIVVTDFLDADTGEDLTEAIQQIIDDHPRKTIYFPDGVYTIAKPIKTSSNSGKAVSLHFSSGAVLKASDKWRGGAEHMVQLGVIDKTFTINSTGTNYYLYGGVIDGNNKAKGVALEGGRETSIRNVVMRNVTQGLHIVHNEEYGSNDSDTEWVVIEGCGFGGPGVLVDGLDNTLSNIRVSGFEVGVQLTAGGNLMHNIYANYEGVTTDKYADSVGFLDTSGGNWYDACRGDGFQTAFYAVGNSMSLYNDCGARWSVARERQIAFLTTGNLNATVTGLKAEFFEGGNNSYLVAYGQGGKGIISNPMFNTAIAPDETYKRYLVGNVVWYNE